MRSDRAGKRIHTERQTTRHDQQKYEMTLRQAFDYFITAKVSQNMRHRTIEDYKKTFDEFTAFIGSDTMKADDVTAKHIREFVSYTLNRKNKRNGKKGLAAGTVNIRLRILKTAFRFLFRDEMISRNPTETVGALRVDQKQIDLLTENEVHRLLESMDKRRFTDFRDYVMTNVILDTGIRVGELCSLEIEDFDQATKSILLPGNKSKNRKPRLLPLSNDTVRMINELIAEDQENWPGQTYIFLSDYGEKFEANSFRRRLCGIYRDRAHITKRVSPHALRHLFCRNYIMNGGDVFSLARIAGHADISTTRRYVDMDMADLQKQHALYSPVVRMRTRYSRRRNGGGTR